jgi:hypothetical protein
MVKWGNVGEKQTGFWSRLLYPQKLELANSKHGLGV